MTLLLASHLLDPLAPEALQCRRQFVLLMQLAHIVTTANALPVD